MTSLEMMEQDFQQKLSSLFHPTSDLQEKAWKRFLEMGLPLPHQEAFRSFRLRELYSDLSTVSQNIAIQKKELLDEVAPQCKRSCIVFVNGNFREDLSILEGLPKGIAVLSFAKSMRSFSPFLNNYAEKFAKEEKNPFALLNAAFSPEGAFIYLPPKMNVEIPIQIIHWVDTENKRAMCSPRLQIFVGKESSAKIFFKQVSRGGNYWVNSALDFTVEEKASLEFIPLINEQADAWHFQTIRAALKKESNFKCLQITNGSKAFQQDCRISFHGTHAEASFCSGWMLSHERQANFQVTMEHHEPHSCSLQKFKGVLNGTSRSSFQGKIYVAEKAQKTQAYQMNNHLLLSEKATASSKPMLEIFADDVKASHGATVGQLEAEDLFYLKSRGLSERLAQKLLLNGFIGEIIHDISLPSLKKEAFALVEKCLE